MGIQCRPLLPLTAPKYCNLAVLAYGYRPNSASSEQLNSSGSGKALEDRTNVTDSSISSSSTSSSVPRPPSLKAADQASKPAALINNSRDSGQSSESVENARPSDAVLRSNGHHHHEEGRDESSVKAAVTQEKSSAKDSGVTLNDDDDAFAAPDVPDISSIPRVRINVEPCEPCPAKEEEGGVVVRRKKVRKCA